MRAGRPVRASHRDHAAGRPLPGSRRGTCSDDDQPGPVGRPFEPRHAARQVGQPARLAGTVHRQDVDLFAVLAVGIAAGSVGLLLEIVRRSERNASERPSGEKRDASRGVGRWSAAAERAPMRRRRWPRATGRAGSRRTTEPRSRASRRRSAVGREARLGGDAQAVEVLGARHSGHGPESSRGRRGAARRGAARGSGRRARTASCGRPTQRAAYHRPDGRPAHAPARCGRRSLPGLPDLRPMLPRPLARAFDSDQHLFEPWWGGVRALVVHRAGRRRASGEVRIVDADGVDRTAALPELAGTAVRVAARSAILDGELVVVDGDGRADSEATGRAAGRRAGTPGRLPRLRPAASRRPLAARPAARSSGARRCVGSCGPATRSSRCRPSRPRAGRCSTAVVAQGLAGMLARQRPGPYLPGVRSRLWRSIPAHAGAEAGRRLARPARTRRRPTRRPRRCWR